MLSIARHNTGTHSIKCGEKCSNGDCGGFVRNKEIITNTYFSEKSCYFQYLSLSLYILWKDKEQIFCLDYRGWRVDLPRKGSILRDEGVKCESRFSNI